MIYCTELRWHLLEQLQAILYFFGHGFCHQLPERSFEASGLYFHVCSRDTGIYLGLVFTVVIICIYYLRDKIKPCGLPPAGAMIACILLVLPMVIDVVSSYSGLRPTTNLIRYVTGYLCGAGIGVLASSVILGFRRDAVYTLRVAQKPTQLATILTATAVAGAAFYLLFPYLGIASPLIVLVAQLLIISSINLLVMSSVRKKGMGAYTNDKLQLRSILIAIILAFAEIALLAAVAHGFHLLLPDFIHP